MQVEGDIGIETGEKVFSQQLVGRCSVCGVISHKGLDHDFICSRCGHPEKIIISCKCCKSRFVADEKTSKDKVENLQKIFRRISPDFPDLTVRTGLAIDTSFCPICEKADEQRVLTIHCWEII